MDRFLDKSRYRSRPLTRAGAAACSSSMQHTATMAPMETTQNAMALVLNTSSTTPAPRELEAEEYAHIAAAVALTLQPIIKETVETAMRRGLEHIRAEMQALTKRLG